MERDGRRSSLSFICPPGVLHVLPESFLHLPLWPIFRQSHPNFRGGRNANASEIWAQLTKNLLTKSGTERFRENILMLYIVSITFIDELSHVCWKMASIFGQLFAAKCKKM